MCLKLIKIVQEKVYEKHQIHLETEVKHLDHNGISKSGGLRI